jgi:hypothetical protein
MKILRGFILNGQGNNPVVVIQNEIIFSNYKEAAEDALGECNFFIKMEEEKFGNTKKSEETERDHIKEDVNIAKDVKDHLKDFLFLVKSIGCTFASSGPRINLIELIFLRDQSTQHLKNLKTKDGDLKYGDTSLNKIIEDTKKLVDCLKSLVLLFGGNN